MLIFQRKNVGTQLVASHATAQYFLDWNRELSGHALAPGGPSPNVLLPDKATSLRGERFRQRDLTACQFNCSFERGLFCGSH